jgi:ankyrin repeat protein
LHCGAQFGYKEIVTLLLKANANPNLKDFKNRTPLDWAIWNNHKDVIDLLKMYNAKTGTELQ